MFHQDLTHALSVLGREVRVTPNLSQGLVVFAGHGMNGEYYVVVQEEVNGAPHLFTSDGYSVELIEQ